MGSLFFHKAFLSSVIPSSEVDGEVYPDTGENIVVPDPYIGSDIGGSDVSAEPVESTELVEETIEPVESTEIVKETTEAVEEVQERIESTELLENVNLDPENEILSISGEDVETYASGNDYYTYLPTWADDYFQGVLENIGDTEYLAYAYREYSSSSSYSYTDYYRLIYDINVVDGVAQNGTYPCIELVRDNGSNGYYTNVTSVSSVPVPTIGYASYGLYSDLRGGIGYVETYALLFAVGVAVVGGICTRIFDTVERLGRRKG